MRKLFIALIVTCVMLLPVSAVAAGLVVPGKQSPLASDIRTLTFICVGDSVNGSIPNTTTNAQNTGFITGWYLYKVEAFPTSGGTAPDAADVMVYDADGIDLLGSEDGGTTAYAGLTLIHATLKRTCLPNLYLPRAGLHVNFYPEIRGALTIDVDNQATASADWTIVLTFVK